jgi:hypothetical protein
MDPNRERVLHDVPLVMFVTNHPYAGDAEEPIKCCNILSLPKLLAEGTPDECQVVLGWLLNMHRLLIRLTTDKFTAWLEDLSLSIWKNVCSQESLDTLVGRLNHTATIMPMT